MQEYCPLVGKFFSHFGITSRKSKNNLDFYCFFLLLFDLLPLKTGISVPSKSNKQIKLIFVGILLAADEKQDPEPESESVVRICGSGSTPKCHRSTTMRFANDS
jgi:hypothetical protein